MKKIIIKKKRGERKGKERKRAPPSGLGLEKEGRIHKIR
jgi:hypothetical protein